MRIFGLITVLLACLFSLSTLSTMPLWAADKQPLRAAAVKVDITPSDLTDLNAWGGSFKDVHDPIFARVLVLDNGVNTAAIVALDLVETGDTTPVRQRIQREIGIPVDHIFITASHDHSAPRAGSVTPGGLAHGASPATAGFTNTLYDTILGALKQAKASLQPARFGLRTGFADINVNRDEYTPQGWRQGVNQDRPSDKTVWVMKEDYGNARNRCETSTCSSCRKLSMGDVRVVVYCRHCQLCRPAGDRTSQADAAVAAGLE
jgi:neutral ceramidase